MRSLLTLVFATLLFSFNALAQSAPPSTVKTVVVIASAKEAEVGQQVKITVTAKDAAGNIIHEKPSTYFAGPFDIAASDSDGKGKIPEQAFPSVGLPITRKSRRSTRPAW